MESKQFQVEGQAKLSEILDRKKHEVVEADHQASVSLAVERMWRHKVGSVVVMRGWKPVGLFTERDLMHRIVNQKKDPATTTLGSMMMTPFAIASPQMSIVETAELMSDNRIRHLPVYDKGRLKGIIYSGDILAWKLKGHERSMKHL